MIKRLVRRTSRISHNLKAKRKLKSFQDGRYIIKNVTYACQFASPELVSDILEKKVDAANDPNWRLFGYKTKEEASYWSWRQCGICCVKMIVEYFGYHQNIADLTQKGVELGGYDVNKDIGWYYKPLVALLKSFNLRASVIPYLSTTELTGYTLENKLVIASVNPEIIRGDKKITSSVKSGHLVLVVGVDIKRSKVAGFYIHNPSGKSSDMRSYAYIPIKTFVQSYGNRGIVVSKS